MKKFIILATSIFLLTGCFSTTTTSSIEVQPGQKLYENTEFAIVVPEDWEIIEAKNITSDSGQNTVVAFRNNIKSDVFTANLGISKALVDKGISKETMSTNSRNKLSEELIGFTEVALTQNLLEFEGKRSVTDPVIHFKQLFLINGGIGYTLTAGYLPTEDESVVKVLNEMLNSFALK